MPNMSDHRFLTRLTWLLFALVILLIGLTLRQSLKQIERLYQSDTLNSAIYLRDQFKQIEVFLEAMRGQADGWAGTGHASRRFASRTGGQPHR